MADLGINLSEKTAWLEKEVSGCIDTLKVNYCDRTNVRENMVGSGKTRRGWSLAVASADLSLPSSWRGFKSPSAHFWTNNSVSRRNRTRDLNYGRRSGNGVIDRLQVVQVPLRAFCRNILRCSSWIRSSQKVGFDTIYEIISSRNK